MRGRGLLRAGLAMLALAGAASALGQRAQVFVQMGHRSAVSAIAFSPDGKQLASAGIDGAIKLWDVNSGRVAATLRGQGGAILGIAWSPDGASLATAGRDRTVQLWDARSGAPLGVYRGHDSVVLAVAFLPQGSRFVSSSYDRSIRLWEIGRTDASVEIGRHGEAVRALDVSRDGRLLVSAGEDRRVRIWDIAARAAAAELTGHASGVLSVRFSPDGRSVASGAQDGSILFWTLGAQAPPRELRAHAGPVNALAYSADGGLLASAAGDGSIALWDAESGRRIVALQGGGEQNAVAFSPRASLVAAGGLDHAVRLWSVPDAEPREALRSRTSEVHALDFSADGALLAVAGRDHAVRLWDAARGQVARVLRGHAGAVQSARFSGDGKLLATASQDGSVRLWEPRSGREVLKLDAHRGAAFAVALSPDGALLASGGRDSVVRLWRTAGVRNLEVQRSGQLELKGHRAAVRDLAFSPDGALIASAANDDTVRLWDAASGRERAVLKGHANRVNAVRFTRDGVRLVTAAEDSTLRVWDVASGAQVAVLAGHKGPVKALAVDAEGRALSVGVDETLILWNLADGALVRRVPLDAGQLRAVAASPRGFIAAAGDAGAAVLLGATDAAERVRLFGFNDGEWLSIVPAGHFHASPNGARYLNVRMGEKVYGLDQFLESFLKPEIVATALGGAPAEAPHARIRQLEQVRPAPAVAIVGLPAEVGGDTVNVRLRLKDRGGGIGDVRVYLNGTAVVQDRAADRPGSPEERNYLVRLVGGRNVIRAAAFNADNTMQSDDAVHELAARIAGERRPSLHALVVGIQEFENPRLKLSYSVADARLFAGILQDRAAGLFASVNLRMLLTRPDTTRSAILAALAELRGRIAPEDLFVFFVASHGTVDEGEYYLLTSNIGSTATERLRREALGERDLRDLLANIPSTKKLIVLDTCNAGRLGDVLQAATLTTRGMEEDRAAKVLSRAVGSTVLSAATSLQQAIEGYNGHGLFTFVVSEALAGKADYDGDGFVKTTELALYVDNQVPELAEKVFRYKQFPIISPTGMGFPVTRAR